MTQGWTGERGNGKSFLMMKTMYERLNHNFSLHENAGLPKRMTWVMKTLGLAPWFLEEWKDYIHVFDDLEDLPGITGSDVYCDDITLRLSARAWDMFPLEVQDWLTACERLSNHFFFTAVTFKRVVIDFRETTDALSVVTKGWGSRRPMIGYPPVKRIWGFVFERRISPSEFRLDSFDEGMYSGGKPHWLSKKYIDCYDHTNVSLRDGMPHFKHRERECPECGFKQTKHV